MGGWGRSGLFASWTDYSAAPDPAQGPIRVRRDRGVGKRARMGPCSSVARPDSGRMTKTRVLVAENHPSIRENLRYLINAENDMACVVVAERVGVGSFETSTKKITSPASLPTPSWIGLANTSTRRQLLPARVTS